MPQQPFLAMITPLSGGGGGEPPLGTWGPNDPRPTPPIYGPGRPPWWGMAGDPGWSAGSPMPPYPSQGPGFPAYPIAGPGRPPWWGMAQDPGYGIPIYLPPSGPVDPGYSPPWAQTPTDPGYSPPWAQVPDLPDTLPPAQGSGGEPVPVIWKTAWSPYTGWVVVGIPTGPTPTPSSSAG